MTLTVIKAKQNKIASNKGPQSGNGNDLEENDESEDGDLGEGNETKVDLIQLVHNDNKQVAELFFQFSQAEKDSEKQQIFDKIFTGLKVHAQLVEEVYYPLLPETAKKEDKEEAQELVFEAEAGNYVASMILDVLVTMKPSDDYFDGKMAALHVLAKEQCKREEKDMFEKLKAAETEIDFDEIGENAAERKLELEEEMKSKGRSKSRAKSSAKKSRSSAKKSSAKASAKSSKSRSSSPKTKSTKAKAGTKSKSSAKAKPGVKSKTSTKAKSGAKSKAASGATSKSAQKTANKTATKKKSASKRAK